MNYQESVTYLEQAASFGIKPGLERIQAILEKLGHPETAYRTIHVTGTNGKCTAENRQICVTAPD